MKIWDRFLRRFTELLIGAVLRLLYGLRAEGLDKLQFAGPTMLVANHVSLVDAVILALLLPREATFVVNTTIAEKFKWLVRLRKHITVDPLNPYSVRQMVRVVQSGVPLVIFPEGRITVTGAMMKMYPGPAYIALKTGARVYPVTIAGAERSKFGYLGRKLRTHWFTPVSIRIGEPFTVEGRAGETMRRRKEEAADRIMQVLQEQLFLHRRKPNVQLFDEVLAAARLNGPNRPICEDVGGSLTYRKLLIGAYALARCLEPLLRGEARVGLLLPNALGHVLALLALLRLGKAPTVLNFTAGAGQLSDAVETADVRTVLTSRLFIEKGKLGPVAQALEHSVRLVYLEDLRREIGASAKLAAAWDYLRRRKADTVQENGAASLREIVLFTSGSESKPKGVVLSHDNVAANILQVRSVIDFTSDDKIFNAMPMFHSFGLTAGTLLPLLAGVRTFLYPSPLHYKAVPELSYVAGATILLGTSTFLAGYGRMAHPYDFFSLRYVIAGGEKLKDDVRRLWLEKFGLRIFEGYGITETSPILSLNTPLAFRPGTVGRLLPGIGHMVEQVEGIAEGGNLLVRGPNVMKGYLLSGQGFVPAPEWYTTGDVVSVDEQGYVTIRSRLKRFAKIGGEMVSLNRVEELVAAGSGLPGSAIAAVAAADPRKGERIVLYTTAPELRRETVAQAAEAAGLSSLWVPSRVERLDKLPLLGTGKTDYVALKALAEEGARRAAPVAAESAASRE